MFNPSRDQSRHFLFESWRKFKAGEPLTGLEAIAVEHIRAHPEYQPVLDSPERYLARQYPPESGETNPFLHLMLHVSLSEQLSIDQPAGIRSRFERLATRLGDIHDAQHQTLDCLAEMIWRAQRDGTIPDGAAYLDCIMEKLNA
jgi:hypothetical protein